MGKKVWKKKEKGDGMKDGRGVIGEEDWRVGCYEKKEIGIM